MGGAREEGLERKKKTILYLESASDQRDARAVALENAGYDVILTDDAREALRVFISQELDVVLVDLRLGNGRKTSLRAEMNSIRPRVPIVALCPSDSKRSRALKLFDHTFREEAGTAALIEIVRDLAGREELG